MELCRDEGEGEGVGKRRGLLCAFVLGRLSCGAGFWWYGRWKGGGRWAFDG